VADPSIDDSLTEQARRIRTGEITSHGLARACLDRIHTLDPVLRAWTWVDEAQVLGDAEDRDREQRSGVIRGPLHGVPIGFKDIFDTSRLPTGRGSTFFDGYMPARDAIAVSRLTDAGAIVLGKLVTTEFASMDPGPTRNPWNIAHTPGGSSSGSAAAVAARMCPAALGTQTSGSVGRPAAYCGVAGLVPTAERIPREGVFPAAPSLDHVGMFARSSVDLGLLLSVLSARVLESRAKPDPVRIGVLEGPFRRMATPDAWAHHVATCQALAAAGFLLHHLGVPDGFGRAMDALMAIMRAELAEVHRDRYGREPDRYGPKISAFVREGMALTATTLESAYRERRRYQNSMRALFSSCDVLISPGATGPAPRDLTTTGDPAMSAPWTFADFPTVTLPTGLDRDRLPLGVQLTAPPLEEHLLLDIASRVEATLSPIGLPSTIRIDR